VPLPRAAVLRAALSVKLQWMVGEAWQRTAAPPLVETAVVHDCIATNTRFFHKYLSNFTEDKYLITRIIYKEINS